MKFAGKGLGYVDTRLLITARYMDDGAILTSGNDLNAQTLRLGVAYTA